MKSLLDLIFPPLCLHCEELLEGSRRTLCENCVELLTLIDSSCRCEACFTPVEGAPICLECRNKARAMTRVGAALEYEGPAKTLVHHIKFHHRVDLCRGAAAFMAVQIMHLDWPTPDLIVPIPQSFTHWLKRGYNQSLLLSNEIGKLLERPVVSLLKRKGSSLPQARMSQEKRLELSSEAFEWSNPKDVTDQIILLVDDVLTTGSTLNACADVLKEGFPAHIYGLCLAT